MFIQKVFKTKKKNFPEDKAIVVHVHNDLCCCCLHSSIAGWLYLLLLAYLITHSSRTSCFLLSFILIAYFDICTYLYFGWLVHFACSATSIQFLFTLNDFFLSQIIWIVFIKDHQSKYHDVMFTRFDENWSTIFLWMQLTQLRMILAIWNNAGNFFYCRDWKYGIERGPRAFCGLCLLRSNCSCQDAFHVLPHSQVCFAILLLNFLRW